MMGTPPKPILLFPFGGNTREALSILRQIPTLKPLGFLDDDPARSGLSFEGLPVLGGREVLAQHPKAGVLAVPGNPKTFAARAALLASLDIDRDRFEVVCHPSATIGVGSRLGRNILLHPGVVLTAAVEIGDHCSVMANTVIAHEVRLGEGCLVGSNVTVSGGVTVGPWSYIGSGSKIRDGVTIGEGALVGLGSVVVKDVAAGTVVAGCPATMIKASI